VREREIGERRGREREGERRERGREERKREKKNKKRKETLPEERRLLLSRRVNTFNAVWRNLGPRTTYPHVT
jgi:hypothetical protein